MNYPDKLKIGDTIGICAPSDGLANPEKILKLELAEKQLKEIGYNIIETESVRKSYRGRSSSAKKRAEEFMSLYENPEVKLIIFATGGDFLCEMLEYLDFEQLKTLKPKWIQGYSDSTGISFTFNTILDIPTMYSESIKDYAMRPLFRNLTDILKIESGEHIIQNSFELYEKFVSWDKNPNPNYIYNLTENVYWNNVIGGNKVEFKGRSIGGCLDALLFYFGTKYDNINNYIEKHKEDGFIWFFDVFDKPTSDIYKSMWQMKNAGYFKYCNGIIFGRPLFVKEEYEISFNESVKDALNDLNIPVICDADIGHVSPQLAIVNGAILKVTSENGKGMVETIWE